MESTKYTGLKGKIQITSELPEAKEKFPISRIPSLPHPTRKLPPRRISSPRNKIKKWEGATSRTEAHLKNNQKLTAFYP